ncbi:MAG TPA: sugar transferase [Candidatus Acidoferrum sp.]|nr:sugar transferase [Candidatus Acidoferrum sp.]
MALGLVDARNEPELSRHWRDPIAQGFKRLLDVLVSSLLLLVSFPFLLVLGIAVKVTSPGTMFYRWHVVGKGGCPFTGYKFRSMCLNADELKPKLMSSNEMEGPVFKMTDDPRVTRLGRWMRRYSLDELPQLYSVLKGDMSLVGPRPPLASEYARFTDFQKQKVAVKPGITCLWQVSGRNDVTDFDDWVSLDLQYMRNWTPQLDLLILFRTIRSVISGTGK